jgi:hypothetical protein
LDRRACRPRHRTLRRATRARTPSPERSPRAPRAPAAPVTPAIALSGSLSDEDKEFIDEHLAEGRVFRKYGLVDKAADQFDSIVARFPDHVEARLELRDLAAILQEIGDDRPVPGDLGLQRAQLRAELHHLLPGRRQQEEVGGCDDDDRSQGAPDELLRSRRVDDGIEDRRKRHVSPRTGR